MTAASGDDQMPSGTVLAVLAWMDADPERARQVSDAEHMRSTPRTTLIRAAQRVIAAHPQEEAVSEQSPEQSSPVPPAGQEQDPTRAPGSQPTGPDETTGQGATASGTADSGGGGGAPATNGGDRDDSDQRAGEGGKYDTEQERWAALEPGPPAAVFLPGDIGLAASPVEVFPPPADDEGNVGDTPDPGDVDIFRDVDLGDPEADALAAEPVTSLQTVSGTNGMLLVLNGDAYSFNSNQTAALGRLTQKASAAVH